MKPHYNIIAVILGGGKGTRLYPLTEKRSKPAVPIAGKYRLIDIPISNCINSQINRIFVLTQFNSASLNSHIKNTYQFSQFSKGFVDILAAEQTPDHNTWCDGTADAVRYAVRHFKRYSVDYFLILSGDQLYQMDFNDMVDNHIKLNAEISIASIPVNEYDATEFGIMKVNEQSKITSFIEKPSFDVLPNWRSETSDLMKSQGKNYLASMGIYLFNAQLMYDLLESEFPHSVDFGKELIPQSIEKYKVTSFQHEGYWTDIGNIDSFFKANLDLNLDIPHFNLFDKDNQIYTRARLLPPVKINGTLIHKSLIADGSIVFASTLENSLIGVRSRIGEGSKLKNCYMMGADFYETIEEIIIEEQKNIPQIGVGKYSYLENCIIDKNSRIGNHVNIIGSHQIEDQDNDLFFVKNGIVVIKKEVVIPHGFQLS